MNSHRMKKRQTLQHPNKEPTHPILFGFREPKMDHRIPKLGSFRHSFAERKERLLSMKSDGYSQIGIGLPESDEESNGPVARRWWRRCSDGVVMGWNKMKHVATSAWQLGQSDPRKIIFSVKMGLALTIISLLIFLKEPLKDVSRYFVWAILTVVLTFEYNIGSTFSKGLNRAAGTLSAAGIALGMSELSKLAGEWEEVAIIICIFLVGFCGTYLKFYPSMKAYEYGLRVFLITYCIVIVSGNRTGDFINPARNRFLLIALGAAVSLSVNIFIYPIWAGEDLHALVAKNFIGVASSLEGVVNSYLNCIEYERVPSKILTYQASDDPVYSGYRSAVESTSKEEALLGFAVWEPPHGRYKMLRYPWKNYVKVSGALRHCAFMVMAMHGCILSEIQAPPEKRQVFYNEIKKVCSEGAKVLRDIGNKVKKMEKLGNDDFLFDVQEAAEELQHKIDKKSFLLINSESWEIGNRPSHEVEPQDLFNNDEETQFLEYKSLSEAVLDLRAVRVPNIWGVNSAPEVKPALPASNVEENLFKKQASWPDHHSFQADSIFKRAESKTYENASSLSLATFTSLLIEFVARLPNLVDSFEELGEVAKFSDPPELQSPELPIGFWTRLFNCFTFKN
ncbi:unnamed protein product [Lupinus luteus]|uniref:Aluminum-activated malate transporter 9 n=1 Tax=Lupinus luteus TaxID=3873 RepID=A0AAV1XSD8_LUPLU